MKTTKQLTAALTAANVDIAALEASFGLGDFDVETDADEDGPCCYVNGTASARVMDGRVYFTVDSMGWLEVDPHAEHGNGDIAEEVYEEWLAQVWGDLGDDVAEYLTERFEDRIESAIADAKYDAADAAEYARDPYAYHGVRRSDFY